MTKRIIALLLCLSMAAAMAGAVSAAPVEVQPSQSVDQCCHTPRVDTLDLNYTRPSYDGYLIDITPQRVEDHFRYLDEVYVERHPEAALVVNTGDHRDQEALKLLAETITEGCTTNTEKANAIDRWLFRNIYYDVNSSAYAYDTFYNRTGNCLSYANLMQFLLRSLGIPAVVGDGWRGDMKTSTVDLFNYEGHAWCFVYLEGEWVLYDPLWIACGTTDRDYIAEWIYLDTVEFVTPAYDSENLPPEAWDKPKVYYSDGIWYNYSDSNPNGFGNFTQFVNNQGYNFTPCQDDMAVTGEGGSDGWYILDGVNDKSGMKLGEIYRNSWLSYGEYGSEQHICLTYAHVNGMQIDGAIMEYNGVTRYMQCNTSFPVLADEADYTMQYGCMAFKPGYAGPFVAPSWGSGYNSPELCVTWSSEDPSIATVDENGILTAVAPGFTQIRLMLTDYESEGYYSITYINVCVSEEERIPDYSDHAPCDHEYAFNGTVGATCTGWGYEIHICTHCQDRLEVYTQEPLGHDHHVTAEIPATCVSPGQVTYTCSRCTDSYTEDTDLDPDAHTWSDTECTLCGAPRPPFEDVDEGDWYYDSVMWAVENGITSGTGEGTFSPTEYCERGQIVTFLWRAAGCPEPETTENPFTDVKESDYFYKAVLWAVEKSITSGTGEGTFSPYAICERCQVVTFLWRAADKPEPTSTNNPFGDVAEGHYSHDAVLWAVEQGITQGTSATTFSPFDDCERAAIVTFLYRYYVD